MPQSLAAAQLLPHHACAQRSHHGADQANGHGQPLLCGLRSIEPDQRIDGPGDDDGVEAEKQSAQRAGERRLHQVGVWPHGCVPLKFPTMVQTGPSCGKRSARIL